jgi:hypothetical protein
MVFGLWDFSLSFRIAAMVKQCHAQAAELAAA